MVLLALHWPAVAADQDEAVRVFLLVPGAIALGQQAPGRGQLLPTAAGLGFACATAVRVVHGVAGHTAVNGPNADMAGTASFAQHDVFVLGIADLADGGVAIFV